MIPKLQRAVRQALKDHPDGLTSAELQAMIGACRPNIRRALRAMPDTYVDRWRRGSCNAFEKVWCVAYVPPDCPHPKDTVYKGGHGRPKTQWRSHAAPQAT